MGTRIVQWRESIPGRDGVLVPAVGWYRFTPTRARYIDGDPDIEVLPAPFAIPLISGALDVPLEWTSATWVWMVERIIKGITEDLVEYIVVPTGTSPIDQHDLVRIDPATLEPVESLTPMWDAILASVQSSTDEAGSYAVDASQSASNAHESALAASQSAQESESSNTQSEKARVASVAAQGKAETAQGLSEQARDVSIQAKTDSVAAQGLSEQARDVSIQAKNDSVEAQGLSEQARDDSIQAKTESVTARGLSEQARDDSIQAKNASVTAQGLSEQARDASIQAKTDSQMAQGLSEQARDVSIQAKMDSQTAQGLSEQARDASVNAKNASVDAKTLSEQARDASLVAKNDALSAKQGSEQARDASNGYAQTATQQAAIATQKAAEATATLANVIPKAVIDVKGDLLVGSANDTVARLPAGVNGKVLMCDSTQPLGLVYGDVVTPTGSQLITGAKTIMAPAFTASVPDPVLGAEMAPELSKWTGANGALWDGSQWTLPAGATISTTLTVVSGTMYQVALTHPYIGQKPDAVRLGSVVRGTAEGSNRAVGIIASGSGSQTVTIGGESWASTLSALSFKPVTLRTPAFSLGVATARSSGYNNALGYAAQQALTTGSSNNALGHAAQYALTTGSYNNALGHAAQYALTTGSSNNALGHAAQYALTTGSYNNALGYNAQQALTTGSSNNALGYAAQQALTTGSSNNALGHVAQQALTTGSSNNALGYAAQQALTTGSYNNALGYNAARTDGNTTTVGTVNYTTCLGHQAQATVSNVAVIGSAITSERQTLCIGNYDALGSGVRGAIALSNAAIFPTSNPTGGGILYAESGALKWRGTSGTITTIANA